MTQRTIVLTERTPTECTLSGADCEFLLANHQTHLVVLPTRDRERHRLTPTRCVGTIVAPDCRLVIRPKLPLRNLFFLLDPEGPIAVAPDSAATIPGTDALDFLAGRLARLLTERAAAGLHRAYTERAEQGPFLHGRLDVSAQLRDATGRKDQLHCRFEELSVNVPINQVAKATAELVRRSPLISDNTRAAVAQALLPFAGVEPVALGPDNFRIAAPDRLTEAYRPLLDLCRLLADSLAPGEAAGSTVCPAFLLDLERVFERYVTTGVLHAFAASGRHTVEVQPLRTVSPSVAGQPDLQMRPDILIRAQGAARLIVDAKWKRLGKSPLVTPDLYQMLAYCAGLGVPRAVLVYPGRRDRAWSYALTHTPVTVVVRSLRVIGSREQCRRSLRRLGRWLRSFASGAGP
jgi:5-methylcytosine-specific restriction enzyme subunit McrC